MIVCTYPEGDLHTLLGCGGMQHRMLNALRRIGIESVEHLKATDPADLLNTPGIGAVCIRHVDHCLGGGWLKGPEIEVTPSGTWKSVMTLAFHVSGAPDMESTDRGAKATFIPTRAKVEYVWGDRSRENADVTVTGPIRLPDGRRGITEYRAYLGSDGFPEWLRGAIWHHAPQAWKEGRMPQ